MEPPGCQREKAHLSLEGFPGQEAAADAHHAALNIGDNHSLQQKAGFAPNPGLYIIEKVKETAGPSAGTKERFILMDQVEGGRRS